jgi:heptosyltransferase II
VVAPSWIGDTILAQPLLSRLQELHSHVAIDVLAGAWTAPLLARMPEVRRVIDSPFHHGEFNLAQRWRLGRSLANEGYDEVIVLPNSWKSALVPLFAGISKRTGFTGESRYGLINNRHSLDKVALPRLADRYARLAEGRSDPHAHNLRRPHLKTSPSQQQAALHTLDLPKGLSPTIFCPGAEYGPAKRWPARHFATLASVLNSPEHPVWLLGSPKDAEVGEEIVRLSHGAAVNLCGRTSLDQAVDLLATAKMVICNDSGLMHVAAALERPLIALFGSSSHNYTPPMSPRAKILSLDLECSPCFMRDCPLGHTRCLNDLTPQTVLGTLRN